MDPKSKSGAYIKEWMESVGLIQSDLVKKLGWSKAKANSVWHGEQRYNEDMLNEVALLVNARPHELLRDPEDVHAERQLRASLTVFTRERQEKAAQKAEPKAAEVTPLHPGRKAS